MASEEEGELKVPEEMFKDVKFYAVGDIDPQVTSRGRADPPPSPGPRRRPLIHRRDRPFVRPPPPLER